MLGLDAIDIEQFAARYAHVFAALSALTTPVLVIVALWLARRLTRRRVLIAATILGDDEDMGPIRYRKIGIRLSNVGHVPIVVGRHGFSSRLAFGWFRRESVRGVASVSATIPAMRDLLIPPGACQVVILCRVDDFVTAYDNIFTRWRKRHARFRVKLASGERFTTPFSRYEVKQLRDSVREMKRPLLGSVEAEVKDAEPSHPKRDAYETDAEPDSGGRTPIGL